MADLKLPELNCVMIAGNLTKDPTFRKTSHGTPVVNFTIAVNRKYRDSTNQWQEEVCYIGVVAWNALAESCTNRLKRGNAVLVEGELQSHTWRAAAGTIRTVVEIKARRIQFLNRLTEAKTESKESHHEHIEDYTPVEDEAADHFTTHESSVEKGE